MQVLLWCLSAHTHTRTLCCSCGEVSDYSERETEPATHWTDMTETTVAGELERRHTPMQRTPTAANFDGAASVRPDLGLCDQRRWPTNTDRGVAASTVGSATPRTKC